MNIYGKRGYEGEGASFLKEDVPTRTIDEMLKPYKPNCKYLKSASLEYREDIERRRAETVNIKGDFSIDESCYIDDTGHFNSVEFEICFNQLAYVLVGRSIELGIIPELRIGSLEEFQEIQLPDCLLVGIGGKKFRKPINARETVGEISLERVREGDYVWLTMNSTFSDKNEGLAYLRSPNIIAVKRGNP